MAFDEEEDQENTRWCPQHLQLWYSYTPFMFSTNLHHSGQSNFPCIKERILKNCNVEMWEHVKNNNVNKGRGF